MLPKSFYLNGATVTDVWKTVMDVGFTQRVYLLNPSSWSCYHRQ